MVALALVTAALTGWMAGIDAGGAGGRPVALAIVGLVQGSCFVLWGVLGWRIARQRTGWERTAWRLFAASVPVTVVGFAAAYAAGLQVSLTPSGDPLESIVTIALYGVIFAGLLVLSFGQMQSRQAWRRALDAAILAGCLFFILWSALYRDQVAASSLPATSRALVLSYPFFDAALLTLAALALGVPDPTRPKAYGFLLLGLALTFAGDVVGTYLILVGSPYTMAMYTLTGTSGMACIGLAAVGVLRSPPWQPAGPPDQPLWARMLPLAAVAPALGSAVVSFVEHGGLSTIQFWTAAIVVSLVLVQLGLSIQQAFRLEAELRGESAFKTRLLRFISHEMANPLSPLRVQLKLLRTGRPPTEERSWSIVDRSVDRLMSLSRDVREMALAETQRLVQHVEVVDAAAQVAAAAESAAVLARQKGLELVVHSALEPMPVRVDQQRFGQVLDNLFSNALKFTHAPGRITVRAQRDGDRVRVQVTDTGIGLSPEDRENLFQPFRRMQDAMAPGLGLGLYLCRAIMGELQGSIGVDSPGRGQGSTFWVDLPLDGTPAAAKVKVTGPRPEAASGPPVATVKLA